MFSLENFYHILYANLLKPVKINAYYFYPFGSTSLSNIIPVYLSSTTENQVNNRTLFYDQEPLIEEFFNGLAVSSDFTPSSATKRIKILANSELSPLKRQLCKEYGYHDWYYFYHGFAALRWYKDYQYLPTVENKFSKVFISLNRLITKDRSYRLHLVSRMLEQGLDQFGHVSLNLDDNGQGTWREELEYEHSKLPAYTKPLIQEQIGKLTSSLIVDYENTWGGLSAECGPKELKTNQSALWHVVAETVYYYDKRHLTEKIFKPITAKRPFILVGGYQNLAYLKSYGFQTFDRWIDESYDNEPDPGQRIEMIIAELSKLCKLSMSDLQDMHYEMKSVLEHNFNHMYGDFKHIIVKEMLDNYRGCLDQWNHARLDDKHIDYTNLNFTELQKLLTQ